MENENVLYHCPCYKSPADLFQTPGEEESAREPAIALETQDTDEQLQLRDPRVPYSLFHLEELYFCDDCHVHRCPRCVLEEVVCVFCPNCLYEVPLKGNVADRCCPRNCFRCPSCLSSMQTWGDDGGGYRLECTYCHWNTTKVGIVLTKPTSLAFQIRSQRPDQLQEHFDTVKKHFSRRQGTISRHESETTKILRQYRRAIESETDSAAKDDAEYTPPSLTVDAATELKLDRLLRQTTLDDTTSPEQQREQLEAPRPLAAADQLLPLRTPLRSKRTKRCRGCRGLLVRPDPRPGSISFRSRQYALRTMPTLSFEPAEPGTRPAAGTASLWLLTLRNPLPGPIVVNLSSRNETEAGDRVVVRCPQVTVGGTSESWTTTTTATDATTTDAASASVTGIHRRGRDRVTLGLELIPSPAPSSSTSEEVRVPVFCQVTRQADEGGPLPREGHASGEVVAKPHAARDEDEDGEDDDADGDLRRQMGFWVVLSTAAASS